MACQPGVPDDISQHLLKKRLCCKPQELHFLLVTMMLLQNGQEILRDYGGFHDISFFNILFLVSWDQLLNSSTSACIQQFIKLFPSSRSSHPGDNTSFGIGGGGSTGDGDPGGGDSPKFTLKILLGAPQPPPRLLNFLHNKNRSHYPSCKKSIVTFWELRPPCS